MDISIRKMNHTDYDVMSKWLSTKEVLTFYGDVDEPFSVEKIKNKYEARVNGQNAVSPFIVELAHTPIGYMQHYSLSEKARIEYGYPLNLNIYGMDQFIGLPQYFDQGIGTQMVRQFVDDVFHETDVDMIVLDPEFTNTRAIKCYEKCGFVKMKKIQHGSKWLMELKADRRHL